MTYLYVSAYIAILITDRILNIQKLSAELVDTYRVLSSQEELDETKSLDLDIIIGMFAEYVHLL